MGYWNINVDRKSKVLNIELVGEFRTEDERADFIPQLFEAQNNINSEEFMLSFDLGRFHLYPCDVEQMLRPFFEMYKSEGYRVVQMKVFKPQKELAYQMVKLAKKVDLETLEIFVIP